MSSIAAPFDSTFIDNCLSGGIHSISLRDFNTIRKLMYLKAGISLSDSKKVLVASRLAKRLNHLNLSNHAEYLDYLAHRDADGAEFQTMVNCLTTNKTDFFREPHHFEFLRKVVFPQVERDALRGKSRKLRIWCAACSTGEEPYSTAISVLEHFRSTRTWDIRILASDINTKVLQTAAQGIYALDRIKDLNADLCKKYFLRGSRQMDGYFQVRPEVRQLVHFQQVNLMADRWPFRSRFDVIFCRNVIIYFSQETQRSLLPRLVDRLNDRGFLMLGHSENLYWMSNELASLGNTIYQRKSGAAEGGLSVNREKSAGKFHQLRNPKTHLVEKPNSSSADRSKHHASNLPRKKLSRSGKAHRREIAAGEYYVSRTPLIISTLLGSCVSACLYDPETRIGGMTHFMLPCDTSKNDASARYGINAMELLINDIMKLGGDRRRLCAKVFGGANVMAHTKWPWNVGQRNIEFIRHFLRTDRIPIVGERLGGTKPLRVFFVTHSGKAYVKEIHSRKSIAEKELHILERVTKEIAKPSVADITLF